MLMWQTMFMALISVEAVVTTFSWLLNDFNNLWMQRKSHLFYRLSQVKMITLCLIDSETKGISCPLLWNTWQCTLTFLQVSNQSEPVLLKQKTLTWTQHAHLVEICIFTHTQISLIAVKSRFVFFISLLAS